MSRRARLLIIDDSPVLFHSLNEFYSQEFSVSRVSDGKTGIDQATVDPPDLILIMEVPDRNINGTIDGLRNHQTLGAIPVLVLLAESTAGRALRADGSTTEAQEARYRILRELLIPKLRSLLKPRHDFESNQNAMAHARCHIVGEEMQVRSLGELCRDFAHIL